MSPLLSKLQKAGMKCIRIENDVKNSQSSKFRFVLVTQTVSAIHIQRMSFELLYLYFGVFDVKQTTFGIWRLQ